MLTFFCCTIATNVFGKTKNSPLTKQIEDFKQVTAYIIANNYHNNFEKDSSFSDYTTTDTVLKNFMQKHQIIYINIATQPAKTISFQRGVSYIFSRARVLVFDYSDNCTPANYKSLLPRKREKVLENCTYYIKY